MEWRNEILKGIDVLPKFGTPGSIVVFGKHAEPILSGVNEDVLVAAAEFGKGRIVAIGSGQYVDKFLENDHSTVDAVTKLHANLKHWLTRGAYDEHTSIISATDNSIGEKLKSSKIVAMKDHLSNITLRDLTEYVRNGGALLHTTTPWVWFGASQGKTLFDVSYLNLLGEAGIYYTNDYLYFPDEGLSIKENNAEDVHLMRVLEEAGTDLNKAIEKVKMLRRLKYVPTEKVLQLSSTSGGKLLENCREEIEKNIIPSPAKPINDKRDRTILDLWLLCHDILQPPNIKAPGVDLFPGDFSTEPPLKSCTIELHSDRVDYHSTGCYLPAGQTLKAEVISGNEGLDWELMIGCHTDELGEGGLKRWPKVNKKIKLVQKSLELSTPFGGLIYLISPDKRNIYISVKLENVVDSPRFRRTEHDKGKKTWENSRHSPGLWADIEGKFVAITLPASSVREMEFEALTSVMGIWDFIVSLYHDLRGTDKYTFRRMWIVTDEQPSRGYMHAGYPIVTHPDVADPKGSYFLLNGPLLKKLGNWGAFHEIGHNMERDEWTFKNTEEVTSNIFTLCAMEFISHIKPWIHEHLRDQLHGIEKFLKDGPDFEKWKTCSAGIFFYAQLVHEFGWESYRQVFRRYERMRESEKPKDDQMKMDTWFSIFSEVVGFNLSPMASFWAIPLSAEAVARLQTDYSVGFLPDDEVTRIVPDLVDDILRKFPGTVRKSGILI